MWDKIRNTCISGVALFYASLILDYNNNSQRTGFASYQVSLNKFMQLRELLHGPLSVQLLLNEYDTVHKNIVPALCEVSHQLKEAADGKRLKTHFYQM